MIWKLRIWFRITRRQKERVCQVVVAQPHKDHVNKKPGPLTRCILAVNEIRDDKQPIIEMF